MSEVTNTVEGQEEAQIPVFQEAQGMTAEQAVNVLVQAAVAAQNAGRLNVRDAVLLAKAIDIVRPGTI